MLFIRRVHRPDRLPLDSNPQPTDYETRALTNAPPGTIDDICTNARKSLRFIRRNLHNCPQCVRNQAYASLVRPTLDYACCVWDPYQRRHIKQLESVQRHAARFTTGNYYSMNHRCVTNTPSRLRSPFTPPLSTPLAPDNCRQIHMWRVRGFPLGSQPEGR